MYTLTIDEARAYLTAWLRHRMARGVQDASGVLG